MSMLATRFGTRRTSMCTASPMSDDQIRSVAPSIFADSAHSSRSDRYSYIPTIDVVNGLRREGFSPFFACQSKSRSLDKREHTKHMLRLRHADQIKADQANEIILINSHDGTSSYQMLAGTFRFVCANGLVTGNAQNDIRVRHNGKIVDDVIEGAFRVLDTFEQIDQSREAMQALTLDAHEQTLFANAALALRYDTETAPAPITSAQLLRAQRAEDEKSDLWVTFNRVQENMIRGGLRARSANNRRSTTREIQGIDQSTKLNRALWTLAEEMRKLKG
jgi:hypothetical protein